VLPPSGAVRHHDSVLVFQGEEGDWDQALARALALGRALEERYHNADHQQVTWRLREVVTLDGREVYAEPAELSPEERLPLGAPLVPELSEPGQTGVPAIAL
jgi:hypothetical protein